MVDTVRDTVTVQMTAPLLAKLVDVEKSLEALRTSTIKSYYGLGKLLKMVQDEPDRYSGTDGTPGIDLILKATGDKHASTLRTALRFADQYTADDLTVLLDLINKKTGFQLIWGHVPILLSVATKADRRKWAARAVREDMSPRDLHTTIKKEEGRNGGHGRPFNIPPTISKQLTSMHKDLTSLLKKNDQSWNGEDHSTFVNIMITPEEELDDDWMLQLDEVIDGFTAFQAVLQKNIEDAAGCKERIRVIIDAREEAATRDAASVAAQINSRSQSSRAVQLADDDDDDFPAAPPVRRSSGRRTVAEV